MVQRVSRVAAERRLSLSRGALALLQRHPFPGNVRELRNVLERAALLADGSAIEPVHVEQALGTDAAPTAPPFAPLGSTEGGGRGAITAPSDASLRSVERAAFQAQLQAHRGSRADLARKLGISVRSLYRKLREIEDDSKGR